jgi:hypothetical protein
MASWGFAIGGDGSIVTVVPVSTADNVLHLAIGLVGLQARVASA